MLFDTQAPTETKWVPPQYLNNLNGLQKFGLGLSGFNDNGTRNTWGKYLSWVPGDNIESDLVGKAIAKNNGATDALANINTGEQRDIGKLETVGGIGLAAAGAVAGQPELIKGGIGLGEQGIGQTLAAPQPNIGEQTTRTMNVPAYARGGVNFKTYLPQDNLGNAVSEDMAMVDKHTGKIAGQISYGERIFSKSDNAAMEKLSKAKDYMGLGKRVSKAMDKQAVHQNKASGGDSIKLSKGGKLSADKAKLILADGKVYNKDISPKQRKLFEFVANGGDIDKYHDGGKVKKGAPKELADASPEDLKLVMADNSDDNDSGNNNGHAEERIPDSTLEQPKNGIPTDSGPDGFPQQILDDAASNKIPKSAKKYMGGGKIKKYADGDVVTNPFGNRDGLDYLNGQNDVVGGTDNSVPLGAPTTGGTPVALGGGYGLTDSLNTTTLPAGTAGATIGSHGGFGDILGQLGGAENIFNIAKFLTGIHGATQPLPAFQKPAAWQNYINTRAQMANEGYTPTELAGQNRSIQQGLSQDEGQIRDISGGNSAYALGAGGGAVNRYVGNKLALGVSNADLHRNNIDAYGNVLGADLGIDAANFGRKYDAAVMSKNANAQLAQQGSSSAIDKINYDKTYGKGSLNQQLTQAQIDQLNRLKGINYGNVERYMSSGNNSKGIGDANYTPNVTDGAYWKKYYLSHPELLTQ